MWANHGYKDAMEVVMRKYKYIHGVGIGVQAERDLIGGQIG